MRRLSLAMAMLAVGGFAAPDVTFAGVPATLNSSADDNSPYAYLFEHDVPTASGKFGSDTNPYAYMFEKGARDA